MLLKAELTAACGKAGASVSRLARQCGINANQLGRWVREHSERRSRAVVAEPGATPQAFVAMPVAVLWGRAAVNPQGCPSALSLTADDSDREPRLTQMFETGVAQHQELLLGEDSFGGRLCASSSGTLQRHPPLRTRHRELAGRGRQRAP